MNAIVLRMFLSVLISLTSTASFYQQCDCPQCNQYSLKVQRCACCVYLLNGKRSSDSHTVLHHRDIDTGGNIQYNSRQNNDLSNWLDVYVENGRDFEEKFEESIKLRTLDRRNLLRNLDKHVAPLTGDADAVRDAILFEVDNV